MEVQVDVVSAACLCTSYFYYICSVLQKTEAKVWLTQTLIRSCAQECSDVNEPLVSYNRRDYNRQSTVAVYIHCCNDRDLCNEATRPNQQHAAGLLALLSCLVWFRS